MLDFCRRSCALANGLSDARGSIKREHSLRIYRVSERNDAYAVCHILTPSTPRKRHSLLRHGVTEATGDNFVPAPTMLPILRFENRFRFF